MPEFINYAMWFFFVTITIKINSSEFSSPKRRCKNKLSINTTLWFDKIAYRIPTHKINFQIYFQKILTKQMNADKMAVFLFFLLNTSKKQLTGVIAVS